MPAMIEYEWVPDPKKYANAMYNVAGAISDPTGPLLFAAAQMREEIKASFLSRTSPDGREWQYWADSYAPTAEAENVDILRKHELLYEAAIDEGAFEVMDDTLYYSTEGWPWSGGKNPIQYGWVHQYGSDNEVIPQREFVGISIEGEAKIDEAFQQWMDNSLALFETRRGSGKLGVRGRSSLGTFLPVQEMSFSPGRRRIR